MKTKTNKQIPVLLAEQVAELVPLVQVRVLFEGVCAVDLAALAVLVAAGRLLLRYHCDCLVQKQWYSSRFVRNSSYDDVDVVC